MQDYTFDTYEYEFDFDYETADSADFFVGGLIDRFRSEEDKKKKAGLLRTIGNVLGTTALLGAGAGAVGFGLKSGEIGAGMAANMALDMGSKIGSWAQQFWNNKGQPQP